MPRTSTRPGRGPAALALRTATDRSPEGLAATLAAVFAAATLIPLFEV